MFEQARKLYIAGQLDEAERILRQILKSNQEQADALNLLGAVLLNRDGPQSGAEECFDKALLLKPDDPHFHNNLGTLLWSQGKSEAAVDHFQQAVSLLPRFPRACLNLGNALESIGKLPEAADAYRMALEAKPRWARGCHNLALILSELGKWQESLDYFNRAISLRPDHARARFGRGMLNLKMGNFDSGWQDYEWRFEATGNDYLAEDLCSKPQWDGEFFTNKTLLVYHDQGLGDAIHFARYLTMVKARGGRVVFLCGPKLFRIFDSIEGADILLNRWERIEGVEFDYHISLLSLPRVFNTKLKSIPVQLAYLRAEASAVEIWEKQIKSSSLLKVGLVWSGKPDQRNKLDRSCSLDDYAPLTRVPGVEFFSLQKGPAAEQTAIPPKGMNIIDYTNELNDFADTAAIIRNLDLVISVDTSVAHLAGALGHPVWTVLCFNHCWRYLLERQDSPWYPTMRLYRQEKAGDWSTVMGRLADDLEEYAANNDHTAAHDGGASLD